MDTLEGSVTPLAHPARQVAIAALGTERTHEHQFVR